MPGQSESEPTRVGARETVVIRILFAVAFLLRGLYIFRFRFDSDEPQHLHTTWNWTQGLVQYRDFFDNHTPLFHIAMSPLVWLIGERPDAGILMRFAMVPLWCVSLWCVHRIATRLFNKRAGLWSAALVALYPGFFFCSIEYRTDNLWTPLWLLAIATAVCGRVSFPRSFTCGFLLGLCFCVSMKTSVMVSVSTLAAVAGVLLTMNDRKLSVLLRLARHAAVAFAGLVIAPAAIVLFFVAQGAWPQFLYGVLQHNILPGVDAKNHPIGFRLIFPLSLPFIWLGARFIAQRTEDRALAIRRVFVFLVATLYVSALYSFWTLLTRQDFLPYYPVLFAILVPALLLCVDRFAANRRLLLPSLAGVVGIALVLLGRPLTFDGTAKERALLTAVLRLTNPTDYVMDFKGECVFRRRAFYYVLEPLTFVRLRRKLLPDTIVEGVIARRACVALNEGRWFTHKAERFFDENFVSVGALRVAGHILPAPNGRFDVVIPAKYAILSENGNATATLDGTPYDGARFLEAGSHELTGVPAGSRIAFIWAQAVERGFSPFSSTQVAQLK